MDALDGNAIGGLLIDVFGTEITATSSTCGACGATRPVAELVVYPRAPGTAVRCRTCGSILMVFVQACGMTSVDLTGLASLSRPGPALSSGTGIRKRSASGKQHTERAQEDGPMPMQGENHEEPTSMSGERAMSMQREAHEEPMLPMSGQSQEEAMSMQDKPHEELNETDGK
jgi:hypothetical protein